MRSAHDLPRGAGQAEAVGPRDEGPPEPAERVRQRYWADRLAAAERPADSRVGLLERARGLPAGHPSSPWDERGLPRQPAPRLADYEISGERASSEQGDDLG